MQTRGQRVALQVEKMKRAASIFNGLLALLAQSFRASAIIALSIAATFVIMALFALFFIDQVDVQEVYAMLGAVFELLAYLFFIIGIVLMPVFLIDRSGNDG